MVGGYGTGPTYHSSTWALDLATLCWTKLSSMQQRRCYVATCRYGTGILAIGGHDGRQRHRSVEFYDPVTNIWTQMASLTIERSDAGLVNYRGRVFAIGGFTGSVSILNWLVDILFRHNI